MRRWGLGHEEVSAKPFIETVLPWNALHCSMAMQLSSTKSSSWNWRECIRTPTPPRGKEKMAGYPGQAPPEEDELKPIMRMSGNFARKLMTKETVEAVCD